MSFDMFGKEDVKSAIDKLSRIPFGGYTGNKRKILGALWRVLEQEDIKFDTVFDAFSGSAVFGLFMKLMGKSVVCNDFLTSSYMNALSLVENPGFTLDYDEMMFVINNEPDYDKEEGFVYKNHCGVTFTEKECIDLDKFRINLSLLDNSYKAGVGFMNTKTTAVKAPFGGIDRGLDLYKHRVKQLQKYGKGSETRDRRIGLYFDEKMNLDFEQWFSKYNKKFSSLLFSHEDERLMMGKAFLLRNMESNVLRNCFVGGRYYKRQVIATIEQRNKHPMHRGINEISFIQKLIKDYFSGKYDDFVFSENKRCLALNSDIIELLQNTDFTTDLIYFDPPYGGSSTDYAYLYQFLEEYIHGKKISELEHIVKYGKRFVSKKTYEENFVKLLELSSRFPVWMLSYNDSSWETKEYITKLLKKYKKRVDVFEINNYVYNYRENKKAKSGCEYIFLARD
jgi:adenine-specific DNA methylase